jgi:hypothetical protein
MGDRKMISSKVSSPVNRLEFSSEELLQQAIAGLLVRLPGVTGVQILQGSQEYGKDIVFNLAGGFGEQLRCGCVVKNSKVTGQADSPHGARTIVNQIQQAFDTEFYDGSGNEQLVQRVYVVTPEPLSPAAIASVKGRLRERMGQIVFVGGTELFDHFMKYWPTFHAEQVSALQQHLDALQEDLTRNSPVTRLAHLYNLEDADKPIPSAYVEQEFRLRLIDIQCNSVGRHYTPTGDFLRLQNWIIGEMKDAQDGLNLLLKYLRHAQMWGFVEQDDRHDASRLEIIVRAFNKALRDSFDESLRQAYTPMAQKVPVVGADAQVKLTDSDRLAEMAQNIVELADRCFDQIYEAADDSAKIFIKNGSWEGIIGDQRFPRVARLREFFEANPGPFCSVDGERFLELPRDILDKSSRPLLIVGPAGHGKTSFCKWSSLRDAERLRTTGNDMVPILIPLHHVSTSSIQSFDDLLKEQFTHSALLGQDSRSGKRLRIYLDGLDEVPDEAQRRLIIGASRVAFDAGRISSLVITARDYVVGPWLSWLLKVNLAGFGATEVDALVGRWLGPDSAEAATFKVQIDATPSLVPLMRTPLLATLILLVYRRTGRLPDNETRLYEIFVDLLTQGWDLAKGVLRKSRFGSHIKLAFLKTLASSIQGKRTKQFDFNEVARVVSSIIKVDHRILEDATAELIQDGIVVRTGSRYEFCHLSFQEFLTAKAYQGDPSHRGINRALQQYLEGDDWWFQVLRFYMGLSGNPGDLDRWLVRGERRASRVAEDYADRARELENTLVNMYPGLRRV